MASTSDLPPPSAEVAAGGAADAPPVAPDPPGAPPPPPSSKRRWSPCTWRYAIEDSQPELGSRQRLYSSGASSALRSGSDQAAVAASSKPRPPNHHHDHGYGEEHRRSSYAHRGNTDSRHSRSGHDMPHKKKRTSPPNEQPSHHFKKNSPREDDEVKEAEAEEDEVDADVGDFGHHADEGKERRKRQMSPSELYFCEMCRAKPEAVKSSTGDNPNPSAHEP